MTHLVADLAHVGPSVLFRDFARIDFRVAKVTQVLPFPEARNSSYKVTVDVGSLGTRVSSAQLPPNYPRIEALFDRLVVTVANLPERRIAKFHSQILIVGFPDASGHVHLLNTRKREVAPGTALQTAIAGDQGQINYDVFAAADVRAATVVSCRPLETDPASCKVTLDLGEIGKRDVVLPEGTKLTEELLNTQVPVLVNLKPECIHDDDTMILTFSDGVSKFIPFGVDCPVKNGVRLF
jgi:tRNA-binding protein